MTAPLSRRSSRSSGPSWSGAGQGKPAAKPKTPSFNTSTASITRTAGIQHWEAKALWPSNAKRHNYATSPAGIEPSVGSVGDSYENALAETINGLYKNEVIHRRGPWRSFEAVEFATLEWVDWFNNRRLLAPIGYIPPAEAEERCYASLDQPAMAA